MASLSDLINSLRSIIVISEEVKRQGEEIKSIRTELRDLTIIVHALAQEIKNSKDKNEQRHENLLLEIENRLLKHEKALPPAKAKKTSRKKR
jgi:archaellum component FlaC